VPTLVAQAGKGDAAAVLEQAVAADDSAALEERQRIVKAAVGPGGDPEDLLRRIRARFDRRARARARPPRVPALGAGSLSVQVASCAKACACMCFVARACFERARWLGSVRAVA